MTDSTRKEGVKDKLVRRGIGRLLASPGFFGRRANAIIVRLAKARTLRRRASRMREIRQALAQRRPSIRPTRPVLIWNASAHKSDFSFFAMTTFVVSAGLELAGERVHNLVCSAGLSHCNIMLDNEHFLHPPCAACRATSECLFAAEETDYYEPNARNASVRASLVALSVDDLARVEYAGLPIGQMSLPSVRWAMRRHSLPDTREVRLLMAHFVASGCELADFLGDYLPQWAPKCVVAFNGTFLPEQVLSAMCLRLGIRFVSFEVGFRKKNSVFFATGTATDVPMEIPEDYELNEAEREQLDQYLRGRFKGDFHVGGRRFWTDMQGIPGSLRERMQAYRQVVTVFTNVVFDTSQVTVNTIYESMFDWLDDTIRIAAAHKDTLFIVRIHPEEARLTRPSMEPVEVWMRARMLHLHSNITIIPAKEEVSSYDLMDSSAFCVVYNSTVGVEAILRQRPVLSGAASKYSQQGFTHLPASRADYALMFEDFLRNGAPRVATEWIQRARRYFHFLVFRYSLDLSSLIGPAPLGAGGYILKDFSMSALAPGGTPELDIIVEGIRHGKEFRYG